MLPAASYDAVVFVHTAPIEDMDIPGFKLHRLKGARSGTLSISVSGNWRITFDFQDGNAYVVNYEDYH